MPASAKSFFRVASLGLFPALALATADVGNAGPSNLVWKLDPTLRSAQLRSTNELVPLYVRTTNATKTRAVIDGLGGSTGVLAGDILTARVPTRALAKLAASSDAVRLEGARKLTGRMDRALAATKADQVHNGAAGTPLKGAGVVVGVIDFGLDLTHGAFKKADGSSRVIGLLDQTASGTAPAGLSYGSECNAATLAAGTCAQTSENGHGTHVTGIAAGTPLGGQFSGVAPEADIVFVKAGFKQGLTDPYEAISTSLCEGVAYVFGVAKAAGKPAVVNMSVGEHQNPHDGSTLADQCLDNLTGPGRIIVAAAGNEALGAASATGNGERVNLHAQLTASATPNTIGFLGGVRGPNADTDLSVWFDAPTEATIRIGAKAGSDAPVFTNAATIAGEPTASKLIVGGKTIGPIIIGSGTFDSGTRGFDIRIVDEDGDKTELNGVTWVLEVTGNGKVDAFIDTTYRGGFRAGEKGPGVVVDNEMSIGFPGITKNVIAVGSYVTKGQWTAADAALGKRQRNDLATGQPVVEGAISSFSSHGPARTTAVVKGVKPDIVAPGEMIAAAIDNTHPGPATDIVKAPPDGFGVAGGTSESAPVVAGAIALMLQKNPTLTPAQIRGVFDATAVMPAGVAKPSPIWGRGQLDALAALNAAPREGEVGPGENPGGADGGVAPSGDSASSDDEGCSTTPGGGNSPAPVGTILLGLAFVAGALRRTSRLRSA